MTGFIFDMVLIHIVVNPGGFGLRPPDFGIGGLWGLHKILLCLIMYWDLR